MQRKQRCKGRKKAQNRKITKNAEIAVNEKLHGVKNCKKC